MSLTSFSVVTAVFVANINHQAQGDTAVPYWIHKFSHGLGRLMCVKMVSWEERHCNIRKLAMVRVVLARRYWLLGDIWLGVWNLSYLYRNCLLVAQRPWLACRSLIHSRVSRSTLLVASKNHSLCVTLHVLHSMHVTVFASLLFTSLLETKPQAFYDPTIDKPINLIRSSENCYDLYPNPFYFIHRYLRGRTKLVWKYKLW